jgi:hypothetical protein
VFQGHSYHEATTEVWVAMAFVLAVLATFP